MNAMMALYDSELQEELFMLLKLAEIKNYTQFMRLSGSSAGGKKEGSVAWPGSNEILLLVVTPEENVRFKQAVKNFKQERTPSPGLLIFDWPLAEVI